jgi:hypothetical protein
MKQPHLCFEDIYFGSGPPNKRAVAMFGSGVKVGIFRARTTGQTLAREEGQDTSMPLITVHESRSWLAIHRLVRGGADVACVVTVRP